MLSPAVGLFHVWEDDLLALTRRGLLGAVGALEGPRCRLGYLEHALLADDVAAGQHPRRVAGAALHTQQAQQEAGGRRAASLLRRHVAASRSF